MKPFLDRLQENIKNYPNLIAIRSSDYSDGVTYRELDLASGRVCQYLKDRNIGKEDFVMVLMPREASAVISVVGIWRAGAAMVLLEEDCSAERVEFIKADLKCKLVITSEVFDEIMECHSAKTYAVPDSHDACYALYTSGSTGNPKGILHEFGKLDTFDCDYDGNLLPLDGQGRFAILTPMNFSPSVRNIVYSLVEGKCLYIVPRNILKNPKLLFNYLNDNKISETSVTCSFFKACNFATEYMKNVFVHSEPCTGISCGNVNVINVYALSEVAFPIFHFRLDKTYRDAPLGYANKSINVYILNEKGENTKPGEIGEIVIEDIYTRGYINLPEKTAEAFKGGYFHTGDLGYFDNSSKAFYCGRKDDMIKINGNRVESFEVESAVKNVLSVNNAVVKGFIDSDRSFIAIYLLRDELIKKRILNDRGGLLFSAAEMKNKLQCRLPDYMIPAYYTVLSEYPKNENGKFSRSSLPMPDVSDYLSPYEPPKTDSEKYFCGLFEAVLKLDKVGVNDDFYQIGGDSISAMMLVSCCEKYELSISELYNGRTPRKIAELFSDSIYDEDLQAQNERALLVPQKLLTEQKEVFEVQSEYPDLTLYNLSRRLKLCKTVDVNRFKRAVDRVFRHHPIFSSLLKKVGGSVKLHFNPELYREIEIISVSPEELEKINGMPCRNFVTENSLLYHHAIYICGDTAYYDLEIHHLITDGTSLKNLLAEITKCYFDESATLPTDYLFLMLSRKSYKSRNAYLSAEEIKTLYRIDDFACRDDNCIKPDRHSEKLAPTKYKTSFGIRRDEVCNNPCYKKYKGNVFYMTCFLKAISEYNKQNKAFTFWTYSGRENKIEQSCHCMLIRTMPMGLSFDCFDNMQSAMGTVKNHVDGQLAQYVPVIGGINEDFAFSPYFIYQPNILYSECGDGVFEEVISSRSGTMAVEFHLIDNSDREYIGCVVKYLAGLYREESIKRFCDLFEEIVKKALGEN